MTDQKTIIAIGDVHGCSKELIELLSDDAFTADELLFLGDLHDRSPYIRGDITVLEIVRHIQDNPTRYGFRKVTVLRGNHEQMLLNALDQGPDSDAYKLWEMNGGEEEFYDYVECLHEPWFRDLPFYQIRGSYLFVHAGVRPNVPMRKQSSADLIWIREDFLEVDDHGLPFTVVHGHSIVDDVDIRSKRINLDTGCFFTGNLSFMKFNYVERMASDLTLSREANERDREGALAA